MGNNPNHYIDSEAHYVHDSDPSFIIDPKTRAIKNASSDKVSLMQYDHNSECFTFEIPRTIEGHDLSLCNVIQIHYCNIDKNTRKKFSYVYDVKDAKIQNGATEDEDKLVFTWLVPGNATEYSGTLSFAIMFMCTEVVDDNNEPDGVKTNILYRWGTGIHTGIVVDESLMNSNDFYETHLDILEEWKNEVFSNVTAQVYDYLPTIVRLI